MSLADLVRSKVALANSLTSDLQPTVTHTPWTGSSGDGDDTYGTPVVRNAFVDRTRKQSYTPQGRLVITVATITILEPIEDTTPTVAGTRTQPIDPRDKFVLSDGTTAPIVQIGDGFEDSGTNRPYLNTVILGIAPR